MYSLELWHTSARYTQISYVNMQQGYMYVNVNMRLIYFNVHAV